MSLRMKVKFKMQDMELCKYRMDKKIKIANGQGFWGDSIDAPMRLIKNPSIDYLTLDYLAEVTMAIMQKQYNKNPNAGFASDFVLFIRDNYMHMMNNDIKVITNAGGVNPHTCANRIKEIDDRIKVAVVDGDNILNEIHNYINDGVCFDNLDTGESVESIKDSICSANIYVDSFIVSEALAENPHIVLGGRITDPGLVVGPCVYEFGWNRDDYDKLALSTVAGHIVECGAQCTGGNHTRWWEVDNLADIGYPILEVNSSGQFIVSKDESTGGLINRMTVVEQLLYEMGDPKRYLSPDVTVDFTSIDLVDNKNNTVSINDVNGKAPTDTLKVAINYISGYKANGKLTVTAPYAEKKANKISEIILDRLKKKGVEFDKHRVDLIGYNSCSADVLELPKNPNEITVSISVKDKSRDKLEQFSKELAPVITNGPPGVTGFSGGRPKIQEVISYWPTLIPKSMVQTKVKVY